MTRIYSIIVFSLITLPMIAKGYSALPPLPIEAPAVVAQVAHLVQSVFAEKTPATTINLF